MTEQIWIVTATRTSEAVIVVRDPEDLNGPFESWADQSLAIVEQARVVVDEGRADWRTGPVEYEAPTSLGRVNQERRRAGLSALPADIDNKQPDSDLIVVSWDAGAEVWTVSARASADSPWSTWEGQPEELDELMGIARDVATGG